VLISYLLHRHRLPRRVPDALEEAILLCEPVNGVVAFAHGADKAAEGICLVLASVAAVLVNLADAHLDRSVVFGLDDATGGAAFLSQRLTLAEAEKKNGKIYPWDVDCKEMLAKHSATLIACMERRCEMFSSWDGGSVEVRDVCLGRLTIDKLAAFVLHCDGYVVGQWGVFEKWLS